MLEQIISIDHSLFELINKGFSNQVFDFLMPLIRNKYTWIPLYIAIIIWFLVKKGKEGLYIIFLLAIVIIASDQISASVIKPLFHRLRPCRLPGIAEQIKMIANVNCGGGFSFVSSHATNHFAMATFLFYFFVKENRWIAYSLFLWAGTICFAQVYVGVHFPIDVLFGGILGCFIGFYGIFIYKRTIKNKV